MFLELPNTGSFAYASKRLLKNRGLRNRKYPADWRPGTRPATTDARSPCTHTGTNGADRMLSKDVVDVLCGHGGDDGPRATRDDEPTQGKRFHHLHCRLFRAETAGQGTMVEIGHPCSAEG